MKECTIEMGSNFFPFLQLKTNWMDRLSLFYADWLGLQVFCDFICKSEAIGEVRLGSIKQGKRKLFLII